MKPCGVSLTGFTTAHQGVMGLTMHLALNAKSGSIKTSSIKVHAKYVQRALLVVTSVSLGHPARGHAALPTKRGLLILQQRLCPRGLRMARLATVVTIALVVCVRGQNVADLGVGKTAVLSVPTKESVGRALQIFKRR